MAADWINEGLGGHEEVEDETPDWMFGAEEVPGAEEVQGNVEVEALSKTEVKPTPSDGNSDDDDDFTLGAVTLVANSSLGMAEPDVEDAAGGSVRGAGASPVVVPGGRVSGGDGAIDGSSGGAGGGEAEDLLSYEDRARIHADALLATVMREGPDSAEKRKWLYSNASPELFQDENHLIYKVMYKFRAENFAMNSEFLSTYLNINLGEVEKSGSYIDLSKYGEIDGSYGRGYIAGVMKHYEDMHSRDPLDDEAFHRSFENYLLYYQQIEGNRVYNEASSILLDGLKSKDVRGLKAGFDDSANYVRRGIAEIEGKLNRNEGTGFVTLRDAVMNTEDSRVEVEKVADFGEINELNKHYGGLYSGMLLTIVGPPKAGKTKFCTRILYDALMKGRNITMWPVEGGVKMFEAQMRAIHFHEFYNGPVLRGEKSREEGIWGVSQGAILKKELGSISTKVDVAALEQASAMDLVTNPNYGSVDMIDRPFNVETFLDEIELSVESNNSSVVGVDYMQLIQSSDNKDTRQALAEAYPKFLDFTKKHNVLGISPAQYSQSAVNDLSKTKGKGVDMRTSIGESSAIMRSSDLVLAMYASAEDIRNNDVTFLSIPARLDQPFEPFSVYADLGTCSYISYKEGND